MLETSRRRRRHALPINAEINITNLVDVAFVLLIIFIITAPIMQAGMELTLPKADAQPLTSSEAVVVSVTQDRRIFLDQNEVSLQDFPDVFRAYMGAHEGRPVSLQGDDGVAYGRIIEVLDAMKRVGHTDVNLITEPVRRSSGARR